MSKQPRVTDRALRVSLSTGPRLRCQALLATPWEVCGKRYGAGDQCPHVATEKTADNVPLCWIHVQRERRIATDGYNETEIQLGFRSRRYAPG